MRRFHSLRLRLLVGILLGVVISALISVKLVYDDASHELAELFDAQLEQMARISLAADLRDEIELPDITHPYTCKLLVRHTWTDGREPKTWESESRPVLSSMDMVQGFGDIEADDRDWRYFGLWSKDRRHHVLILQDHAIRERLASSIATRVSLQTLAQGALLALFIVLLVTYTLRPLRALVLALSAPDPLQVRLPPAADLPQELEIVARAFDRLLGRFRKQLERERNFASSAAHELRTPLAGLSAQLQVLGLRSLPDPQIIHQAQHAAWHLSTLIDQLLLLARMDANQVQAKLENVDLHELALDTIARVQDDWPQRDITWDMPQSSDPCWRVRADPTLLRVLLINILDNACKHGPANPTISIRVHTRGAQCQLVIEDNGPGIPQEWMSLLQQRFERASTGTSGLGIGLALVREIVHLHGGQLALDHSSLGGLRVSCTFAGIPAAA